MNDKLKEFLGEDRKLLCYLKFGSHLYGTATKDSDTDYKGIYLPSRRDYFLQNAPKTFHADTGKNDEKNSADDVDIELFSLNYFVELSIQGQTVAMDMLHCNEQNTELSSNIWDELVSKRSGFYQKELKAFVGYAQKQAAKYGIKGSRLNDAKSILDTLSNFDGSLKFSEVWETLPKSEHCYFINEDENIFYNMCGKKLQGTITVEYATGIIEKFYKNYGSRAKAAANSEGVDWKAISHAMRACVQLKELYQSGTITFPLKDADYLLKVKSGELEYPAVAGVLEFNLSEVHRLANKSEYPDRIDRVIWENWLVDIISKLVA